MFRMNPFRTRPAPETGRRTDAGPQVSVIVIVHNMRREAARTLWSLTPDYQLGVDTSDYEVCVIENGSSEPLDPHQVSALGENFSYRYLENPPLSPAHAINIGARHARGEYLCIMIDGACILTPGALSMARTVFPVFSDPVVMTRYFFLGPCRQNISIAHGYTKDKEDELLRGIDWPQEGYRLFEIGAPLPTKVQRGTWFDHMFESCCMFLRKSTFERMGGCDEQFDYPGGGFLLPDLFRRAALLETTDVVQLIGEGVFHQLHGGTTTNTSPEDRENKLKKYQQQYRELRGENFSMPADPPYSFGHRANKDTVLIMQRRGQQAA